MSRISKITRNTTETQIQLEINLDGSGKFDISLPERAGMPFFAHMLEQFAKHGSFDLKIVASGDVQIDGHHLVEDLGIALGLALDEAVGNKRGIARYGYFVLPMDETLMLCAVDFCGRAFLQLDWNLRQERLGEFDVFLVREFLVGLSNNAKINLHLKEMSGGNAHHVVEASFKSLARAMKMALKVEGDELPTTKGLL
ncbi:imidazoleglycerol-phosphate dehydratase [Abditibacterium utsteinense]|uniref:Imidazoleglycerol-phosphate dehydratase n=1 Tax=Abditibacterium utsteinense TaxID=1960156 RepID=A0A2S8SUD0_9BACT|nr:imidazoleglycerol-phosphate dehydratase HisB [Abditibacterium utsteinense]PQV64404.1 imidazoleglycerol-phosphate dehydratase [Abditibacterium utsteinense]